MTPSWLHHRPGRLEPTAWFGALQPAGQATIVSLRPWPAGPNGGDPMLNGLAASTGPGPVHRLLRALAAVLTTVADGLTCHATPCPCVGEDEARLAEIVHHGAQGDRETALCRAVDVFGEADLIVTVARAARLGALIADLGAEGVPDGRARARLP
ncbi:MAG: hypothetical protein AAFZ09_16610 [Pseudomonadota bacterium]